MDTADFAAVQDQLEAFCHRWHVRELALFGSALRDDFTPHSDVDVLITFHDDVQWSLLDHATMQHELASLLGRPVDLVSRRGLERSRNWLRREEILRTARTLIAA